MFFSRVHKSLFKLPYQPYGFKETERVIEIPWALSCIESNDQRVLDVGYAFAEDRYLNELVNLNLDELHGVDYVLNEHRSAKILKKQADLRTMDCYPENYFDVILCVSTIEHVGHNNDVYFEEKGFERDFDGDLKALRNLAKILKPKGKLVISVPYGKKVDYNWFVQYDEGHLNRLLKFQGLKTLKKDLFVYRNRGWSSAEEGDLRKIEYKGNEAPAAAGLACVLMQKL